MKDEVEGIASSIPWLAKGCKSFLICGKHLAMEARVYSPPRNRQSDCGSCRYAIIAPRFEICAAARCIPSNSNTSLPRGAFRDCGTKSPHLVTSSSPAPLAQSSQHSNVRTAVLILHFALCILHSLAPGFRPPPHLVTLSPCHLVTHSPTHHPAFHEIPRRRPLCCPIVLIARVIRRRLPRQAGGGDSQIRRDLFRHRLWRGRIGE